MINGHTPFAHHLFKIAVANPIAAIPANRPQDHFALKMPPLEIDHQKSRSKSPVLFPVTKKLLQQSLFEQYVLGRSQKELAVELNGRQPTVPGPRGLKWRDTAIRGHRDRGAGILNNDTYIGRLVFNRRNFRKNPETENREARMNDKSEWVVGDVPDLRIVSDELWAKVKTRQMEVEASFSHTTTNRLNRTHRPSYLLIGLLECQHCSGPYAIMAKDRYGCTNRQKKLPIEHLGDIVCTNSKTISRQALESRILDAIPARLLSVESTASIQDEINKQLSASRKAGKRDQEKLQAKLAEVSRKQEVIAGQITERSMNAPPDRSLQQTARRPPDPA